MTVRAPMLGGESAELATIVISRVGSVMEGTHVATA